MPRDKWTLRLMAAQFYSLKTVWISLLIITTVLTDLFLLHISVCEQAQIFFILMFWGTFTAFFHRTFHSAFFIFMLSHVLLFFSKINDCILWSLKSMYPVIMDSGVTYCWDFYFLPFCLYYLSSICNFNILKGSLTVSTEQLWSMEESFSWWNF